MVHKKPFGGCYFGALFSRWLRWITVAVWVIVALFYFADTGYVETSASGAKMSLRPSQHTRSTLHQAHQNLDTLPVLHNQPESKILVPKDPFLRQVTPGPCSQPSDSRLHIPKVVHQTYKSLSIPALQMSWARTFWRNLPTWSYHLYTDADNEAFVARHYPWLQPLFDAMPRIIHKVDTMRLLYLHKIGGIYADFDVEVLKPLEPLFEGKRIVLGLLDDDKHYLAEHNIPNAVMASVPGHPFWVLHLRETIQMTCWCVRGNCPGVEAVAGPIALQRTVRLWNHFWNTGDYLSLKHAFEDSDITTYCPRLWPVVQAMEYTQSALKWRREHHGEDGMVDLSVEKSGTLYPASWKTPLTWPKACKADNKAFSRRKCHHLVLKPWSYTITYWTHSWDG